MDSRAVVNNFINIVPELHFHVIIYFNLHELKMRKDVLKLNSMYISNRLAHNVYKP